MVTATHVSPAMAAASFEDGLCYNSILPKDQIKVKNHDMHEPRQSSSEHELQGIFFSKKSLNDFTRQLGQLKGLLTIFPSIQMETFSVCHPAVVCRQ